MNDIAAKLAEEGAAKVAEAWPEVPDGKSRSRWSLTCDEGVGMGGEDSAPTPLLYFAAGVAF
jgi:hypothetical protein